MRSIKFLAIEEKYAGSIPIFQKAHRLEAWGYKNKAHLRGLCRYSRTLTGCRVECSLKIEMLPINVRSKRFIALIED